MFRQRHLHDYAGAALAMWLAIAVAGALSLGWALVRLAQLPWSGLGATAVAVALATLASRFALKLPRSDNALSAADAFIFAALAAVGPAAAVLAAGVEAWSGTRRISRRLSSWVASPAAAMAAMALCGLAFEALRGALERSGIEAGLGAFVALIAAAIVPYLGTTQPLMAMMALKGRRPLQPRAWLSATAGVGAVYIGSALVAALVHLCAQRFGPLVYGTTSMAVFALIWLLRIEFRRQLSEQQEQEGRVRDAERESALNQKRFEAAFSHAAIGMAVVRPTGEIMQVNEALCALLGCTAGALIGRPFRTLLNADDAEVFRRHGDEAMAAPGKAFSMELRLNLPHHEAVWVSIHCSRYEDPGGLGESLIYQLQDITSRQLAERRLHHIAHHDALTNLANRHCFQERLSLAVERTRQDADYCFGVLFMDLDRFKTINDSFGHQAGDEMLRQTAQRLREGVRPTDLVARLGGDEFAVLLDTLADVETGRRRAEKLLAILARPLRINGVEIMAGASLGLTVSDLGYRTANEMLRDADLAMYEAKAAGRGRVVVFDSSMHEKVAQKLALEADLRHAIGEGELSLCYQPLYRLQPHALVGFEALLRWVHPQRGAISPTVFIALAEETGHIEAITNWVIDNAAKQLGQWQRRMPGRTLRMNVNISSRDLARPGLVKHVHGAILRHGLAPRTLVLEITETTLMSNIDMALATMKALKALDVGFAVDDFGTGYSSLAYLGQLPIDSLKIDRSFVKGLSQGSHSMEIVRTIHQLGCSLGRRVVAEGIETTEQLAALREIGVHEGQGYLLSRPLRQEQAEELLAVEQAAAVSACTLDEAAHTP